MHRLSLIVLGLVGVLWASSSAAASPYASLGDLERQMVDEALEALGAVPALAPEGRTVCAVVSRRFRIIQEPDKLPMWLNALHRVSRANAVERAVTLSPGDRYSEIARADSERQLRNPTLFSVAVIVPIEHADDASCIDVLVVTRDAWSLTTNIAPEVDGGILSSLYLGVTEANLFGTTHAASLSSTITPLSWTLGPSFAARRLGATRWSTASAFTLHFDRERSGLSGTSSALELRRPLFASDTRWAGGVAVAHSNVLARTRFGRSVRPFVTDVPVVLEDGTMALETVDERWRERRFSATASVTRSFGLAWKHHVTLGMFYRTVDARTVAYRPTSDAAIAAFEAAVLPREGRRVGPTASWSWFQNRYLNLRNVSTYAIAEEVRVGPSESVSVSMDAPALGSDERVMNAATSLGYVVPLNDGFVAVSQTLSGRFTGDWSDLGVGGAARWVSAPWFWGRLLLRVAGGATYRNDGNARVFIGGRTSVRGYAEGFAVGDRWLRTNAEWRSNPLRVFLLRVGFAAFMDGAATWAEGDAVDYYPSVGVGVRLFIPQLGTQIRAFDLAFPLRDALGAPAGRPVFSYGLSQSF